MHRKLLIATCLIILLCSLAKPLELVENIAIYGNGSMNSITQIPTAEDRIKAQGHFQNYERKLNYEGELSSLISEYTLINNMNAESSYSIAMKSPEEKLQHFAEISGSSDIFSRSSVNRGNSIDKEDFEVSTDFNISGQGKLTERVIDQNIHLHPTYIVNTEAEGESIFMTSALREKAIASSETIQYLSKLPKTEPIKSISRENADKSTGYTNVTSENSSAVNMVFTGPSNDENNPLWD